MKQKFIALWLSLICIVLFILQSLISGFTELFYLDSNSLIEPWRLLTSIFLHGSVGHLVYNLFALILFGLILEKLIGTARFIAVFFVSGIFASIISFALGSYPGLGASGAIMGIIGALAIIRPMMSVWAFGMIMPMFVAAILWVGGDVIGLFTPADGIGHIAHLSGILFGAIFGIVIRFRKKKTIMGDKAYRLEIPENLMEKWEDRYM